MQAHATPAYRWPTKLKKFGITDPCLMWVVAKYENEIPWQKQVNNQEDLAAHVASVMWPRQRERMVYPVQSVKKSAYVAARHVDLELALTTDQELDRSDIEIIRLIRDDDGAAAATAALVEVINQRKRLAFEAWLDLMARHYAKAPAFILLLLRPLLEQAGAGSRRTMIPPNADVVAWLYRRICEHRLSPNENLAKVYAWKLGAGSQRVPRNGWQYIPAGAEHAAQLVAAAAGSGWCVASYTWARRYLRGSCFYILRSDGRPEVALRSTPDGRFVQECQGRYNQSPTRWFVHIELFRRGQEIVLGDRRSQMDVALAMEGDLEAAPAGFWQEHLRYWPFVAMLAPEAVIAVLPKATIEDIGAYVGFPRVGNLVASAGASFGVTEWAALVAIDPVRFAHVPEQYADHEDLLEACRLGWAERLRDGDLTIGEIQQIPECVKKSDTFMALLREFLPDAVSDQVRRPPRTADERLHRLDLDAILPASDDDPFRLAVEHAVNCLLTNESCDFSDHILPEALRNRADFPRVREQAWKDAIEAQPPLWFAVPDDLKDQPDFAAQTGPVKRVDVAAWEEKVRNSPWLLTQKSGVPKSVRLHERILEAYLASWMTHLQKMPWKIWINRGYQRRVYLSYGALADPRVLEALTAGWLERAKTLYSTWSKASYRMRTMSLYQVSVLRAVGSAKAKQMTGSQLRTCLDVVELHRYHRDDGETVFADEVRERLIAATLLSRKDS